MRRITSAACCTLLLVLALAPAAEAGGKKKQAKEDKIDLVWPPPPMTPRVRYIASIRGREDVAGKRKLSFAERLMGKSPERDQMKLIKPYGCAVAADGTVFVVDSAQKTIFALHLENKSFIALRGSAQYPLSLPIGVALDPYGRVFVTDASAHRVVVFQDGRPVSAFGFEELSRPSGIAVSGDLNRIYVVDTGSDDVAIYDLMTFELLKRFGGRSSPGEPEEGLFLKPTNIAVNGSGHLYVSDTFNRRVQVFDGEGGFLLTFGAVGMQPGDFVRPKGIAVDADDHVYVTDAEFNNVQIFNSSGDPMMFFGSYGAAPGRFLLPTGMGIGPNNRICVAEHGLEAGRLQIFEYLPEAPGSEGALANQTSTGTGEERAPGPAGPDRRKEMRRKESEKHRPESTLKGGKR